MRRIMIGEEIPAVVRLLCPCRSSAPKYLLAGVNE